MKTTDYQTFAPIDMPKAERRKLDVGDIYANQVRCKKCGDQPRSKNRHDYRPCKCGAIAVDGGSWYAKRTGADLDAYEDLTVMYPDHEL